MAKSSKTPKMSMSKDSLKMGGVVVCVILALYVLYRMMYGCEKSENFDVSKCDIKQKKNKVTYYERCIKTQKDGKEVVKTLKCCDSDSEFNCPDEYNILLNSSSGKGTRPEKEKSGCKVI